MSFFHTILNPRSMIYNPEDTTHRGRVIETNQRLYQLEQARQQAQLKVENETTNLNPGVQAIALAVMTLNGEQVDSIDIVNPGRDYKYPPLISFQDDGHLAKATAVIDGRKVIQLTLITTGISYTQAPRVEITGGGGADATAHTTIDVNGSVTAIILGSGGTGYTTTPNVQIINLSTDLSGGGAQATATLGTGQITIINVTNAGKGYANPKIVIVGVDNTADATAKANLVGNTIGTIDVTQGGSGYFTVPQVVITDDNIAVAESVINTNGEIININVIQSGRNYSLQPQITIASPSTPPTLEQRNALHDKYLKDFLAGLGVPFDIINAQFSRGQVKWAEITGSMSSITNPLWVPGGAGGPNHAGNRKIETVVPCPHQPEIIVPDNPPECYFSIHNDGKMPIQEDRFTHNMRIDRNDNPSYIIKKANETVQKQVDNIIKNGGTGAIIFAIPHGSNGTITGFDIQNGGQHFTTNPPDVVISRLKEDPGKAKATISLNINGYIDTFTITNPSTNLGYTQSTPPDVYIAGIKTTTIVTIGSGSVTGITINSDNNLVSYNAPPVITITRTMLDTGKAKAVVATVDVNGAITGFTITQPGTGYNPSYKPRVSVTGGRGQVNAAQKQVLLDQALLGAFDHLQPNWNEVAPGIKTSGYKTDKSSGIIENNRSLQIIDVTDKLTRQQRQDYIHKEDIIDKKARESALSRYNKAVALGLIPNVPAIPTAPVLPTITITTPLDMHGNPIGSGAILEPYIDFEGNIVGFIIKSGGSGYSTSPPELIFTPAAGDGGFGAAAKPIISNGIIADVEMIFGGYDYFAVPDIDISGGGGTGASFTAVRDAQTLKITDVTVNSSGSNYLSIDLSGGGGSGFKGLIVTKNGVIIQIIIQDTGSGYNVQQPPNAIYLEYLAEAQHIVKRNEPPGPGETAPPTGKLPEPTLMDRPGNMGIKKLNEQKRSARRAKSTVITVAIDSRMDAKTTYEAWKADQTPENKTLAQKAYNKAVKATASAYGYQKWLPPASDMSLKHKAEIFP